MGLIRPSVILVALVMTAPALYRGLVLGDLDLTSTMTRFLIAIAVAAVMLAALRMITAGYGQPVDAVPVTPEPADADPPSQPG